MNCGSRSSGLGGGGSAGLLPGWLEVVLDAEQLVLDLPKMLDGSASHWSSLVSTLFFELGLVGIFVMVQSSSAFC